MYEYTLKDLLILLEEFQQEVDPHKKLDDVCLVIGYVEEAIDKYSK